MQFIDISILLDNRIEQFQRFRQFSIFHQQKIFRIFLEVIFPGVCHDYHSFSVEVDLCRVLQRLVVALEGRTAELGWEKRGESCLAEDLGSDLLAQMGVEI